MNIYNAIMAAADLIETNPRRFNYRECCIPREGDCGTPGCALGWIGAMAGLCDPTEELGGIALVAGHRQHNESYLDGHPIERSLLGIDQMDFYGRMSSIDHRWSDAAAPCAAALRIYAEQYHGHEKPKAVTPPNWQTIATSPLIPENVKSEEVA